MSNNFEWQKFHTEERIKARLHEADNHRLAKQNTKDRRFQISIFKIVYLYVTRTATKIRSVINRVNPTLSGPVDHTETSARTGCTDSMGAELCHRG